MEELTRIFSAFCALFIFVLFSENNFIVAKAGKYYVTFLFNAIGLGLSFSFSDKFVDFFPSTFLNLLVGGISFSIQLQQPPLVSRR